MSTPLPRLILGLAFLILVQSGCSLLTGNRGKGLPNQVDRDYEGKSYVVIITRGEKKSRHQMVWEEGLFLQDVLNRSGVRRQFNKMLVEIKRPRQDGVQTIPMKAKFQDRKKLLTMETNYAVHPGDFVMITDVSKSAIDQLVDSVTKFVK